MSLIEIATVSQKWEHHYWWSLV